MENDDIFSTIYRIAKRDQATVIITADNGFTNFNSFKKVFPKKFFNFGISEANMISFAAGMASCGRIPYVFAITTFLTMRAFEQIRNDICLSSRNVKLVGVGAGLNYSKLGNSHHAIEDLALLSVLPNMTIMCPGNMKEMKSTLILAKDIEGPVYIRFNNLIEETVKLPDYDFKPGKGVLIRDGFDVTIMSTGDIIYEVIEAADMLEGKGISVRIVHMNTVKPLDRDIILESVAKTKTIVTVEEHSVVGGFGSGVADVILKEYKHDINFGKVGINDFYPMGYGTWKEMKHLNGLSPIHIALNVEKMLRK